MKMEKLKQKKFKNNVIVRTCVITRANDEKSKLLKFIETNNGEYIFDEKQNIQHRGIYIKNDIEVFQKFFKKYKINLESAEKALKYINSTSNKKDNDEILINILEELKLSEYLVYGVEDNVEGMKDKTVQLLIVPSDLNSKQINRLKKTAKINNTKIIFISKQSSLKAIFSSNVTVIGIKTKKVVRGILNKMEVDR